MQLELNKKYKLRNVPRFKYAETVFYDKIHDMFLVVFTNSKFNVVENDTSWINSDGIDGGDGDYDIIEEYIEPTTISLELASANTALEVAVAENLFNAVCGEWMTPKAFSIYAEDGILFVKNQMADGTYFNTGEIKCDCGAHKVKDSQHSTWCSLALLHK